MLSNSRKITALQIYEAEQTIREIIGKKIIQFNIGRIRNAYKNAREKLNVDKLSDEQKLRIKNKIINDEISEEFKQNTYQNLKAEFENYKHIRNNINNINDLSLDAVDIEKNGLINVQEFHKIIKSSIKYNEQFITLLSKFNYKIYGDVTTNLTENKQSIDDKLILINELYDVSTDTDDIEIITKFGYKNNLDFAHELSGVIKNQNYSVFKHINVNSNSRVTNNFLSYLFSDKITNNKITLFPTTLNSNINYQKVYRLRTLGELLLLISDSSTKYKLKEQREQLYTNTDGTRPKENEYRNWNGLQVYDLDLKNWIDHENGDINQLKSMIHEKMINYHWYLWIVKSSSGNGLHIYTKVSPPHHQYTNPIDNELTSKYWFNVNYITKLNFIYNLLDGINKSYDVFNYKKFDNPFVDNVVSRITAGIRLSFDENPYVNNKFIDMSLTWGLGQDIINDNYKNHNLHDFTKQNIGEKQIIYGKTVNNIRLFDKKVKLIDDLYFNISGGKTIIDANTNTGININDLPSHIKIASDLSDVHSLNRTEINYFTRYNVCNTLAGIMGVNGLSLAHDILKSNELGNTEEINSFYTCALSNAKKPSKLGLEILKKVGIIKSVSDELKVEIQTGFKNDLRIEIEKVLNNDLPEIDYYLGNNEFLGDIKHDLMKRISGDYINILFSPAGTGKTSLLKQLALDGKRVLLVLPYVSVIRNKIENDESVTKDFDVFYGGVNIKDIEYGRNAVTTFDKFSRINYDKVSKMFDYIFIDESHLLFTSSYRIEATSNVIKKLKELFYISTNDELSAKLVLMTGTETGESHFFNDVGNIIRVHKRQPNKNMEFVLCDDLLDGITRMANSATKLLEDGYRLLIPTNKGEIYSEKIIGMISYILKREIKYGYYKRSNNEQEICRLIDVDNTVGDYEIIFCSNYLSVGVDINDGVNKDLKFASLYMGDFSGYEIEQFNARIRQSGIDSKFFIITEKQNGDIYNALIDEPNLILKVTDNDRLFFVDDKAIAGAKQEFIAEYDPVLKKIVTPGFSLLNGKIQFNLEEYELISFENKYSECMEHPVKVARELSKYGYNITISDAYDGLDEALKNILKQTGIESAKAEKIRKHQLIYNTFIDLINNNNFVSQFGLEYNNTIAWIRKQLSSTEDILIEDRSAERHVQVIFDAFASPQKVIVKSKEAVEKIIGYANYLITRYSQTKCLTIFEKYVDTNGVIKMKNFKRAINLLKLIDGADNNELSRPLEKSINKIYEFVDDFEADKDTFISYHTYQSKLDLWTQEYVDDLGIKINTRRAYDKIRDSIMELMFDICKKSTSKRGIRFTYNKLPDADSQAILNKRSIDQLIGNVFNIIDNHSDGVNKIKSNHIILEEQNF